MIGARVSISSFNFAPTQYTVPLTPKLKRKLSEYQKEVLKNLPPPDEWRVSWSERYETMTLLYIKDNVISGY